MKHPNNIRKYRLREGLSEEALAQKLGLKSKQAIVNWENGATCPRNGAILLKLGAVLHTPIRLLYPEKWKKAGRFVRANAKKHGIKLRRVPLKKR